MKAPEKPANEDQRLSVLNGLEIIHTPAEERFDRITRLAKMIFKVPIALVSLVNEDTQWFKSSQGLAACETPREVSFCGHAILGKDTFIVPDALNNPDFSDNPLVINEPHVRFYAGEPVTIDSQNLGTLCLIDHQPREFSESDVETLKILARMIENELKLTLYTQPQKEVLNTIGDMERKSLIDPATGCWNQKGINLLLGKELDKAHRDNIPITLLLIEVDYISDEEIGLTENHHNIIIKEAAQRIRSCIRLTDIIGRVDTNQFLVYLHDCNNTQSRPIVQNTLRSFSTWRYELQSDYIPVSIKIGIASNQETENWSEMSLMKMVKDSLAAAKNA